MTYEEIQTWAMKHYNDGADFIVECWDRPMLAYVEAEMGRKLTLKDLEDMISYERELEAEAKGWA